MPNKAIAWCTDSYVSLIRCECDDNCFRCLGIVLQQRQVANSSIFHFDDNVVRSYAHCSKRTTHIAHRTLSIHIGTAYCAMQIRHIAFCTCLTAPHIQVVPSRWPGDVLCALHDGSSMMVAWAVWWLFGTVTCVDFIPAYVHSAHPFIHTLSTLTLTHFLNNVLSSFKLYQATLSFISRVA